jgi:flagellar basal body-associated protein FliL
VKDVILQTLSRKTSHDLINEEGKNKLRAEIQEGIGRYFKDPKLTDVMFTEFVIQL